MLGKQRNRRGGKCWNRALDGLKVAALLLPLTLAACDDLLDVNMPGNVTEADLDASVANTLMLSTQGNVEYAWSQYTYFASHHSDEWNQQSGNRQRKQMGLRLIDPGFQYLIDRLWSPLHVSLQEADEFASLIAGFDAGDVPQKNELIAKIKAYGAWPVIALAEGFCGSPIGGSDEIFGAAALFTKAEARFTAAMTLASAAGLTDFENMARVGRARARLGLGNFSGAIADAEMVPVDFAFMVTRDTEPSRRRNKIHDDLNGELTVDKIGSLPGNYWDLKWKDVPDLRIVVEHTGEFSYDFVTEHHRLANKHTEYSTDMILATWREAQMIIADASAQSGDLVKAIEILNAFHTRASIPDVTDVDLPTQADVITHVIQERSREFFADGGYRLFDHNRWRGTAHEIPFLGEAGSFYPIGIDHHGERFGDTTCLPVPRNETTPTGGLTTRIP